MGLVWSTNVWYCSGSLVFGDGLEIIAALIRPQRYVEVCGFGKWVFGKLQWGFPLIENKYWVSKSLKMIFRIILYYFHL